MPNKLLTNVAEQLITDGRRDREVLRRRWQAPSWRAEIERIANVLERHPLLIPAVEKAIDDEMKRLGDVVALASPTNPTMEATIDADRQNTTLQDVQQEPPPQ